MNAGEIELYQSFYSGSVDTEIAQLISEFLGKAHCCSGSLTAYEPGIGIPGRQHNLPLLTILPLAQQFLPGCCLIGGAILLNCGFFSICSH